jgi:hypothetical protein
MSFGRLAPIVQRGMIGMDRGYRPYRGLARLRQLRPSCSGAALQGALRRVDNDETRRRVA